MLHGHDPTFAELSPHVKRLSAEKDQRALQAAAEYRLRMSYRPEHIAEVVQRLADSAGSQRKLAKMANVDSKTVNNAVHMRHGLTVQNAYKLAEAGGITILEFLGESPEFADLPDDLFLARLERLLQSAKQAAKMGAEADRALPSIDADRDQK